jgi:hypothetical protein
MPIQNNITNQWAYSFIANNTTSFTVLPPSSVNTVLLTYYNLSGSAAGSGFVTQLSTNGAAGPFITSGYQSQLVYTQYTSSSSSQSSSTGLMFAFTNALSNSSGQVYFYGLNSSSAVSMTGTIFLYLAGAAYGAYTFGILPATTNVNALQFSILGGNISTGIFKFYGLN